MRLRILIASDHYPPFFGGAHRQTALLAEELSRRGHEVSVATVWHPGLPERDSAEGVEVYRFKQIRTWLPWLARGKGQRHQPPFPDPVTITGLRRLIDRFKPDVIHSYGWISYSVAVALAGKDIPLLLSARDYGYFCATRSLLYENKTCSGPGFMKCLTCSSGFYGAPKGIVSVLGVYLSKPFLVRKTRGIHSVSHYVQRTMEDHLLDGILAVGNHQDRRVIEKVIPSFLLPLEQPTNHHDFIQQLPDQPYILYVGGLQHRKGLDILLSAYQKLNKPPSLVLVGYPSNDMPVEYPEGVQVFMNVPHANVMEAWDRSLFGVTPSLWPDPSPGVVREAMSRGKAVIVTSIGGSTEMINESSNGLLVPPGDANALAHAMQRLIDNPELREQLGKGGRNGSMQYMSDVVVPQFEQLYTQMVDGPEHENENHAGRGTEKPANKPFLSRLLEHLRSPLFFNGYALTLSSAATSIIGLLYWLLAARYYPAEVVGRNSAAIATILFLSGLAGLNLDGTLIRFIPRAGRAAGRLVGMVYAISILVALLVSPVYLLGIHLWSPALSFLRSDASFVVIFILAVLTGIVFVQEDGALVGLRQAKWVAVENSTYAVLKLALLVVFASKLPQYGILISWILPVMLIIPAVNFFIFRRFIPKHITADRAVAGIRMPVQKITRQVVVKYTASNYLGYLFYLAYSTLPPLMVIQQAGSKANAYFYLPWVIFSSLRLFTINMGTSMTVEGSMNQEKLLEYFHAVLRHSLKVLLPIVLAVVIAAPFLLQLFGHEYAVQGTALLRLLTISIIPNTLIGLYLGVIRLQYRFRWIVIIQGFFAVIALGLSYFLLPKEGITGVGIAWLVSQTILAGLILIKEFGPIFRDWSISSPQKKSEKLVD
ncbi:MAG: glycosyltransferase [Omnitrophica WOR_2 bacterium]